MTPRHALPSRVSPGDRCETDPKAHVEMHGTHSSQNNLEKERPSWKDARLIPKFTTKL